MTCLEDFPHSQTKTHDATCVVLEGAAFIQVMKPAATKTFGEYAQRVCFLYNSSQERSVSRVGLFWDKYKDSMKTHCKSQSRKRCNRNRKLAELFAG